MNIEENDIDELLTHYLAGESTPEQETRVRAWIAASNENEKHFQKLKRVFDLSRQHFEQEAGAEQETDLDAEWALLKSKLGERETKVIPFTPAVDPYRNWIRIAAAVALFVVGGLTVRYFIVRSQDFVFSAMEASAEVQLPDGSRVLLNRHSKISYRADFGTQSRNVTLEGEAFFDVVRDPLKPFSIQTGRASVTVLGTSFDVQSYSHQDSTVVVVETGVVKFKVPSLGREVELTPGERGTYSKQNRRLTEHANQDPNFRSWSTQQLSFHSAGLRAVVRAINRTYGSKLVISTDVPVGCLLTASFDHQSLDAVLNVLETTLGLTFRKSADKIEIIRTGC